MPSVFISYARPDAALAREVVDYVERLDREPWVDWARINPSAKWLQEIYAAIDRADAFVIVVTLASAESTVCALEIAHAEKAGKRIFPLLFASVDRHLLPEAVASRQWIDCRDVAARPEAFALLRSAMESDPEWVALHTELTEDARAWASPPHDASRLLRGARLRSVERSLDSWRDREPRPTADQRAFVAASRRRASRVFFNLASTLFVLSVSAVVAAAFAWVQWGIAVDRLRTTESQRMALESRTAGGTRPELALSCAVAAVETSPTIEARRALWAAINAWPQLEKVWRRDADAAYRSPEDSHVAWSWDGASLFATSRTGDVSAWQYPRGDASWVEQVDSLAPQAVGAGTDFVATIAGSLSGTLVLRESGDPAASSSSTRNLLDGDFRALAVHPEGRELAAIDREGVALVLRPDGSSVRTVPLQPEPVSLAYANGGRTLVASGKDGALAVLTLDSGTIWRGSVDGGPLWPPLDAAEQSDEVVMGLDSSRVLVGRLTEAGISRRADLRLQSSSEAAAVGIDHAGGRAAIGRLDGGVEVGELRAMGDRVVLTGTEASISDVEFSRDGRRLAVADTQDGLTVWRVDTRNAMSLMLRAPSSGGVLAIAVRPDGQEIAASIDDGTVLVLPLQDGANATVFATRDRPAYSLDYSPDGAALAAGDVDRFGDGGGAFAVYDRVTAQPRFPPRSHRTKPLLPRPLVGDVGTRVLFDDSGTLLVTAGADGMTRAWDAHDGTQRPEYTPTWRDRIEVGPAPFLRLGRRTGWSPTLLPFPPGPNPEGVVGVAPPTISADGLWTAVPTGDRWTRLAVTKISPGGTRTTALSQHPGPVSALAFQPSGTVLVSGDRTGDVRFWDLDALAVLGTLTVAGHVADIAFTPDGRWVVVATRSGEISAWPATTSAWRARACNVIAMLGAPSVTCVSGEGETAGCASGMPGS